MWELGGREGDQSDGCGSDSDAPESSDGVPGFEERFEASQAPADDAQGGSPGAAHYLRRQVHEVVLEGAKFHAEEAAALGLGGKQRKPALERPGERRDDHPCPVGLERV